ncbi:hypothetical protein ACFWF7_23765 [Nocardia sp. NPDC060256]|uniref:hypothetical protein n=1 Tax=unclassified Nocardia TaxID=2637762 RepID=UPI0036566B4A
MACTLFRLLTGTVPFEATNPVAVIQGHLQVPPPPVSRLRPGLPVALDAVLAKALAKRADERFDSCAEFAGAAWHALTAPQQFAPFPTADQPSTVPRQPPTVAQQYGQRTENPTPEVSLADVRGPSRGSRPNVMVGGLIGVLLVLGLIASIIVFSRSGTGSAGPATTVTAPTSTAATTSRISSTPSTKPSTSPRPTPDRTQVSANAAALSNEFSAMLPEATPRQTVQAGTGYNKAGCFAYTPGSAAATNEDDPALGDWLVLWRCFGGQDNKAAFSFYLYNSPADARSALDGLPASDRSTADNHGHVYTNYTLHDSQERRPRMVTEFTADPQRASMLMYSAGFIATQSELMTWWIAAPLN